jgi:uncharacterized protein (TIGR03437 family)
VLPVTVTLADVAIQVVYAGAAPGFAGLLQVNARPPAWLLPGTYSLVLKVGGIASPAVNLALY